jgi:hypothetical protein
MKKQIILLAIGMLASFDLIAQQFKLSAEIRPRYEYRHGYKSLFSSGMDGAHFISQRTRLNVSFSNKSVKTYLSFQNVRVWGDVSTLSPADFGNAIHEAWAEITLIPKWYVKLGRQEIVYDDHRIFGNVGWAQQARSHDAFLVKFIPGDQHRLDFGLALNADIQANQDILYSNVAGYKTFQYLWYHGKFGNVGVSLLALNTGVEYDEGGAQKINYMQTTGPRVTFKSGNFEMAIAGYLQTGKKVKKKVNAFYVGGHAGYKLTGNFKFTAGFEMLSGKDTDDTSDDIKSFAPLFGTNHKFNGWMDYFYVGNHAGSVGLVDIYGNIGFNRSKFSFKLIPHIFMSHAKITDMSNNEMDKYLGTEIDMAMGYKLNDFVKISAGFSKMFATDSMEILKGGDKDMDNNWAWIMFSVKPVLFASGK